MAIPSVRTRVTVGLSEVSDLGVDELLHLEAALGCLDETGFLKDAIVRSTSVENTGPDECSRCLLKCLFDDLPRDRGAILGISDRLQPSLQTESAFLRPVRKYTETSGPT